MTELESTDHHIYELLAELVSGSSTVIVGEVPRGVLDSGWPARCTDTVVITRAQRQHYLERHPELYHWEHHLLRAILFPDQVHQYSQRTDGANFLLKLDDFRPGYFLLACLAISHTPGLENSLISALIVRSREVEKSRERGLLRWTREGV
jgi:hypothetical protein